MLIKILFVSVFVINYVSFISTKAQDLNNLEFKTKYFLPNTSKPLEYHLRLNVELGPIYQYNGTVDIEIKVFENVQELVLHSRDLKINVKNSILFNQKRTKNYQIVSATEIPVNRFLVVLIDEKIPAGYYTLRLVFSGNYYSYANGFFLSTYEKPDGTEDYILATQFEPIGARDLFPCYDEPNLKAKFMIEVTHPKHLRAFSNMPIENVKINELTKTTTFQKTHKMSTYLIAIAVADYGTMKANYKGRTFAFHVQKAEVGAMKFSVNITLKSIEHYERLLGVNYVLPKLDGIVVPIFGGGMENWGLIVYGQRTVVQNVGPPSSLRSVVNLITHEIAHQWFGDLVTLDWWTYVWLNEGFATYYAQRISDLIYPSERFMDRQVLKLLRVLRTESQPNEDQAINRPVIKPEDLHGKFDSISYDKGSAIIRFMQMTFKSYDKSIVDYLKKHAHGNTVPNDLYKSIDKYETLKDNLTINEIMKGWGSNPGYPLLTVKVSKRDGKTLLEFSQNKFSINNAQTKLSKTWWIPITFATKENPNFENLTPYTWIPNKNIKSIIKVDKFDGWIIVNLQKAAYMRVNYDTQNWKKIIEFLNGPDYKNIHYLNRVQLIDDVNNLAEAGLVPESIALDLLNYLEQETDEIVIEAAVTSLQRYAEYLRETEAFSKYSKFVKRLLGETKANQILQKPSVEDLISMAEFEYSSRFLSVSTKYYDIFDRLYTSEHLDQVESLLLRKTTNEGFQKLIMKQIVGNIARRKRFLESHYENVKQWLDKQFSE